MKLKFFTAISCLLVTASLSTAGSAQSDSQRSLKLQLKDKAPSQPATRIRCRADAAILAGSALALECRGQNGKYGLLLMPNTQNSTDFAISLLDENLYRYFVVKPDLGSTNCLKARQNSSASRPCFKVESARLSLKDSPVNVGNANPNSGPNIPTAPADPDWPNIPTQDAEPG